jgi:DNA-binding FadR family transcriptional regulator
MKRKKYFDWEQAFHFIWENADRDGIWHGDAANLASTFEVSEETAREVLDELRGRRLIEMLYTGSFYVSNWREKDNPDVSDQ